MSKQSEARERQQYTPKLVPNVCGNCAHFTSKIEKARGAFGTTWMKESALHCSLGGFTVKKMGSCAEWAGKGTTT